MPSVSDWNHWTKVLFTSQSILSTEKARGQMDREKERQTDKERLILVMSFKLREMLMKMALSLYTPSYRLGKTYTTHTDRDRQRQRHLVENCMQDCELALIYLSNSPTAPNLNLVQHIAATD